MSSTEVRVEFIKSTQTKIDCLQSGNNFSKVLSYLNTIDFNQTQKIDFLSCSDPFILLDKALENSQNLKVIRISKASNEMFNQNSNQMQSIKMLSITAVSGTLNITEGFFPSTALQSIALHRIEKLSLANAFKRTTELRYLTIGKSRITDLDDRTFRNLVKIKRIIFENNNLTRLPDGIFSHTIKLKNIFFVEKKLRTLPMNLFLNTKEIEEFQMTEANCMENFPENIFSDQKQFKSFLFVRMKGCLGSSIGSLKLAGTMFHNSNVQKIRFIKTGETEIPSNFLSGCSKLEMFQLQDGALVRLPPHLFKDSRNISYVDFSGNSLESLPPQLFEGLTGLTTVRLKRNNFYSLDQNLFKNIKNIKIIHLQSNRINTIEISALKNNKQIEEIDLSGNAFTEIPKELTQTESLKTIRLAQNAIKAIRMEDILQNLTNLNELDLKYGTNKQNRLKIKLYFF